MERGAGTQHKQEGVTVHVTRLPHCASLPSYATPGSSGVDVAASIGVATSLTIPPGERALIPTGIQVAIPEGYEIQARPRSGLAVKHGIMVLNSPGTVDSDYRGEVKVLLLNMGSSPFTVSRGDRIAQLVLCPVSRIEWREVDTLPASQRGEGGFGSTGK